MNHSHRNQHEQRQQCTSYWVIVSVLIRVRRVCSENVVFFCLQGGSFVCCFSFSFFFGLHVIYWLYVFYLELWNNELDGTLKIIWSIDVNLFFTCWIHTDFFFKWIVCYHIIYYVLLSNMLNAKNIGEGISRSVKPLKTWF